jgi:hypothetical protein
MRDLWQFLRSQGIDAHMDLAVAHRNNWAMWMDEQIRLADHILVVASPAHLGDNATTKPAIAW